MSFSRIHCFGLRDKIYNGLSMLFQGQSARVSNFRCLCRFSTTKGRFRRRLSGIWFYLIKIPTGEKDKMISTSAGNLFRRGVVGNALLIMSAHARFAMTANPSKRSRRQGRIKRWLNGIGLHLQTLSMISRMTNLLPIESRFMRLSNASFPISKFGETRNTKIAPTHRGDSRRAQTQDYLST